MFRLLYLGYEIADEGTCTGQHFETVTTKAD